MKINSLIKIFLAILFLLQPMVIYLTSYVPGDCDDKSVHYFAAAFQQASTKRQKEFKSVIGPFMENSRGDPGWERTDFRLSSTASYPLANVAIGLFMSSQRHFSDSVKWGLFVMTLLSLLVFVSVGSGTRFGFWQTVLVANLIAFYSLKVHFLVPLVPGNMHPFITYVPRGATSLLILAPVLAFAARKWWFFAFGVLLTILSHVGMGGVLSGLLIVSLIIYWLTTYLDLFRKFRINVQGDFYSRLFWQSLMLFVVIRLVAILTGILWISNWLGRLTGLTVVAELPKRLSGSAYSLLVLLVVVGVRLFIRFCKNRLVEFKPVAKNVEVSMVVVAALVFLALNHLSAYRWVATRSSGFFMQQCRDVQVVNLPNNVASLSFSNEPEFFLSLAQYLNGNEHK